MARSSRSNAATETLSPLNGGFEVYVVHHHRIGTRDDAIDSDSGVLNRRWQPRFLLVNFSDTTEARTTFSRLSRGFGAERCQRHIHQRPRNERRLQLEWEAADTFCSNGAVIFSGTGENISSQSLGFVTAMLRSNCIDGPIVRVADALQRPSIGNAGTFIIGVSSITPDTAMAVFELVVALNTPPLRPCEFDAEDVLMQGPSRRHAVLVEAICLRAFTCEIVYSDAADELAVREADFIIANFVAENLQLAELTRIQTALRKQPTADWCFTSQAPREALVAPCLPLVDVVAITMIVYRQNSR